MKSKIIMTSMVGLAFAMPAFAVPSKTSNTFPQNGQMQEDTKYIGQATQTNLHSYEGPVSATANYTDTPYTVTAGNYLPMSSETVAQCTAGNYCPGINGTVNYSTSANQGLTACPGGYPNSLAGATADTECYTACTVANAGIDHASAVSGNDYYGTGTDTCVPTSCDSGYHLAPNLTETMGNTWPQNSGYRSTSGSGMDSNESQYGITQNGEFVIDFGNNGKLHGFAQCSTQSGKGPWNGGWSLKTVTTRTTLPDSNGQYCWCQYDGYTPLNGTTQVIATPWVFSYDYADYDSEDPEGNCAYYCAYHCSDWGSDPDWEVFRDIIFGLIPASSCEANVISITWDGADQTDIDANNAGQCTYGGDINTPKKAVHVPGKTFVGWTFEEQDQ